LIKSGESIFSGRITIKLPRRQFVHLATGCISVMAGWLAAAPPASAEAFDSSYSSIAEKRCPLSSMATRRMRVTLTIGKTVKAANREPAARDHYGAFNGYGDRVEWRSVKRNGPFA